MNVEENVYTHRIKHIFIPVCFALSGLYELHASCANVTVTSTSNQPNLQVQSIAMPPQFTDMKVDCNTSADTLCTTSLNVTDNTIVLDTTTPGEYINLNNYNFLRSNRSIFPTFDNELILTPTFVSPLSRFGTAVAISGDGSILAVGSNSFSDANPMIARVDIYQRKGATWVTREVLTPPATGFQIFGTAFSGFGAALSLSYDGSILTVGAPSSNNNFTTQAALIGIFIYEYNTTTNRYALIQTINGESFSGLANSLQLSATGQYLVVANDYDRFLIASEIDQSFNPSARVYVCVVTCDSSCRQEELWEPQADLRLTTTDGSLLVGRRASNNSGNPCQYVTISGDGNTIALGWPRLNTIGFPTILSAVTIFKRTGSTWQQTQLISQTNWGFGTSVSLSADGSYLAIGNSPDSEPNVIHIFALRGTQYVQEAVFTIPKFGPSTKVSLSSDGTIVAVGTGIPNTSLANGTGSVAIAVRGPNNSWTLPYFISGGNGTCLGCGIACSADGAFVIAGEFGANGNSGAVRIYRPVGSFVPNDTVVTGSLCVYNRTTIDSTLRVQGNIHLNGTIVTGTAGQVAACTTNLSDQRVKTDITPLSHKDIRAQLHKLKPVTFDWLRLRPSGFEEQALLRFQQAPLFEATESYEGQAPLRSHQVGFIAQQIEKIFPHWVSTMPAMEEQAQLIDDGQVKMITIKPELYAYLVAALEYLVQKNNRRNEELRQT